MNQPENKSYYQFAATLPVAEDGPNAPPTGHPVTTLADSLEQARALAGDAGLTLLGQLDAEGNIIEL